MELDLLNRIRQRMKKPSGGSYGEDFDYWV